MKLNWFIAVALFLCLPGLQLSSQNVPQVDITNGLVKAKLYLPDAKNGYYQGARFDWSGVIPELEYAGHSYFDQWFPTYDPKIHDAILGPVEEFFEIGYSQAKVGEEFLRIGIGGIKKPEEERHNRFGSYEISNPGKWDVKTSSNQVVFTHTINDVAGHSYVYTKTVRLTEGKPELVLDHTLKNTGKQAIKTVTYNHNFFVIDRQPISPDVVIRFPYDITGTWGREDGPAVVDGKNIKFTRTLATNESISMSDVSGHNNLAQNFDIRIENTKTGAGVRIIGDKPIQRMLFWSSPTTACPEPYIDIDVPPGGEFTWKYVYEFYTLPSSN